MASATEVSTRCAPPSGKLYEEVGLNPGWPRVADLGTWMDVYGAPSPNAEQVHTANTAYLIHLDDPTETIRPQVDEVAEARWFSYEALPEKLAFPDHVGRVLSVSRELPPETHGAGDLVDRTW